LLSSLCFYALRQTHISLDKQFS